MSEPSGHYSAPDTRTAAQRAAWAVEVAADADASRARKARHDARRARLVRGLIIIGIVLLAVIF